MDGRWPHLSSTGRIVSGGGQVWVDGKVVAAGYRPQWLNDETLIYGRLVDAAHDRWVTVVHHLPTGIQDIVNRYYDAIHAGGGKWYAWDIPSLSATAYIGSAPVGLYATGCGPVKVSRSGRHTAHVAPHHTEVKTLYLNHAPVATAAISSYDVSDQAIVWTEELGNYKRAIKGRRHDSAITETWTIEDFEGPSLVDTPEGPWVLSVTHTGVILRPAGQQSGYRYPGIHFDPEGYYLNGQIRIVATGEHEILQDWLQSLDQPRVDLHPRPPVDVFPGDGWTQIPANEIDVVPFICGTERWSRSGLPDGIEASNVLYTHPFQSRTGVSWTQHTKQFSHRYAVWTYTDEYIGLAYDRTNELELGYRIVHPGTNVIAPLYPRRMKVGQQYATNVPVEIHDLQTNQRHKATFSGYVHSVWAPRAVGDIPAVRHALIVYDFISHPNGMREQNWCAEGYGPWAWQETKKNTGEWKRWYGVKNYPPTDEISPAYTDQPRKMPPVTPTTPASVPVSRLEIPRDQLLEVIAWLRDDIYPNRVGHPLDDEGIAAWVLDVYVLRYRIKEGLSHSVAKQKTLEWMQKEVGIR